MYELEVCVTVKDSVLLISDSGEETLSYYITYIMNIYELEVDFGLVNRVSSSNLVDFSRPVLACQWQLSGQKVQPGVPRI